VVDAFFHRGVIGSRGRDEDLEQPLVVGPGMFGFCERVAVLDGNVLFLENLLSGFVVKPDIQATHAVPGQEGSTQYRYNDSQKEG